MIDLRSNKQNKLLGKRFYIAQKFLNFMIDFDYIINYIIDNCIKLF